MSSYQIEVPEQVVTAYADYLLGTDEGATPKWLAKVYVGGVTVMEREYVAEWGSYDKEPENYAEDSDDAKALILEEFGEKLKKLLEV